MERDGEDQSRRQREEPDRLRKDETPVRPDQREQSWFLRFNLCGSEFGAKDSEAGARLLSRWPQNGPKEAEPSEQQAVEAIIKNERMLQLLRITQTRPRYRNERLTFFRTQIRDSEFRPQDSDAVGASPSRERPKDLEERFQRDLAIFKGVKALQPNVWSKASMHDQVTALKETERQLAADQGRPAYRVFADSCFEVTKGREDRYPMAPGFFGPPPADWIQTTELKGKNHEQLKEMSVDRRERIISISNCFFFTECCSDTRPILELAGKSFRAYQMEVLDRPNNYPEVNAEVLEIWKDGLVNRGDPYEQQPLEHHADAYALRLYKELRGQDYFSNPDPESEWPPRVR